jgi:NADH-quinone oxidoreductase subunit G
MNMVTIFIDGQAYPADPRDSLLAAALALGLDLPYFCWHPALGSVGACRQCAVTQFHDADDTRGHIVMACMTPVQDGLRIGLRDAASTAFRAQVIAWLMENHPHDCPVCEEGGECHLQDMTLMTGHTYRRYRFDKRTYRNQDLGPFLTHEMNRCIACYRCVRFYNDYAGGHDLHAFASHNRVYFGRYADGALENEFSGNLAEVCPTGVFDDKTFSERYARKWDLQSAPSICPHCSLGCNTHPNARDSELRRILNRYHGEINGDFLCDRGRFGYGYVNSPQRVRQPLVRRDGVLAPATRADTLTHLTRLLRAGGKLMGIGSPRACVEANFALRALVGADNFYVGSAAGDHDLLALVRDLLCTLPAHIATPREAEDADAVLVLGEDVPNTAPRLALGLRQAVRQAAWALADELHIARWQDTSVRDAAHDLRSPLYIATPEVTRLDDVALAVLRAAPVDLARLGFAIAHAIDPAAPAVTDLPADHAARARAIAQSLMQAQRPLIVSGLGCGSESVIRAAANIALALHRRAGAGAIMFVLPECNSLGAALFEADGLDTAIERLDADTIVVILENDLYRRAERHRVGAFLAGAGHVIVIDHLRHATARAAEVVLPASTFAEGDGTLVNHEARAQRFFQVLAPAGEVQESWRWLREMLAMRAGAVGVWPDLDALTAACAQAVPAFARIPQAAPSAAFRIAGAKIARQPARASGRTANTADISVHEPTPPPDVDAPFNFSMEGYAGQPPPALTPFFWAPQWNSVQALNKFQSEIGGPLRGGDPGVRLRLPDGETPAHYAQAAPPAFAPPPGKLLVITLHHVFGSDELSMYATPIMARAPHPYLALNPDDAAALSLREGALARLVVGGTTHRLPVVLALALPRRVSGLPAGLPELAGLVLPAWGQIDQGGAP